jgi:hypothetical protein
MHTGQNSIAAENSLPQLGQVRWAFLAMDLLVNFCRRMSAAPSEDVWIPIEPAQSGRRFICLSAAPHDNYPMRGMKACRALRWRTIITFHKIFLIPHDDNA